MNDQPRIKVFWWNSFVFFFKEFIHFIFDFSFASIFRSVLYFFFDEIVVYFRVCFNEATVCKRYTCYKWCFVVVAAAVFVTKREVLFVCDGKVKRNIEIIVRYNKTKCINSAIHCYFHFFFWWFPLLHFADFSRNISSCFFFAVFIFIF